MLHGITIDDNLARELGGHDDDHNDRSLDAWTNYDDHVEPRSLRRDRPHVASRTARRDDLLRGLDHLRAETFDPDRSDSDNLAAEALEDLYDDVLASGAATAAEYRAIRDDRERGVETHNSLTMLNAMIVHHRMRDDSINQRLADAMQDIFDDEMDRARADHDGEIPASMRPGYPMAAELAYRAGRGVEAATTGGAR